MPQFPQVEGFILIGGKSSRMGRDKALLEIAGKPLLLRTSELLSPLVASVSLMTSGQDESSASDSPSYSQYAAFGLPMIADRWPDAGPLGAIATALAAAQQPFSLILACDLPYLTNAWLAFLLARATNAGTNKCADIFIPESAGRLEPLCAVYRSSR